MQSGSNKNNKDDSAKNQISKSPYSSLGLVFEFLGVLGFLPTVGYVIDTRYYSDDGSIGLFFFLGMGVGFAFGIYYMYHRAQSLLITGPSKPGDSHNREGYHKNVSEQLDNVEDGMDEIGKKIDELKKKERG